MLLLGVLQAQAAGGVAVDSDFDLLEQRVLDTAESSVTFSSLSTYAADYQHLQIRAVARATRSGSIDNLRMTFNGSTGTYRTHYLTGNGSNVTSSTAQFAYMELRRITATDFTANAFGTLVIDILDPFVTTKNKTIRALGGVVGTSNEIHLQSGAWFNTEAVTSIGLTSLENFAIGSRFSLYGIKAGA